MRRRLRITVWGAVFVVLLTSYYAFLAEMLPHGAGPDELAHLKAAEFIYQHERLAVYPDDKEDLHYSKHGATRSFRPPLVYIASASIRSLTDRLGIELKKPYRTANALLGALCALFLLLALYTYTKKIGLAVFLTTAFALMPQVAFIFAYLNADGAAFMASSLVLFSVCILLKKGVNTKSLAFFGFACGVLSLSKITAWVFCFPVCLFAVFYILRARSGVLKPVFIVLLCFALTGGWRIAFNVYHHGVENVFNRQVEAELKEQYARVQPGDVATYEVLDKGHLDLLSNYDNFLTRTYMSFVGHLDWLRLRVGPVQYTAYGIILLLGFIGCFYVILKPALTRDYASAERGFEISVIAGCVLLFYAYMHFNIHYNIQTQGKYILPAFPGFLVVLASFLLYASSWKFGFRLPVTARSAVFPASLLLLTYVHAQALYKYAIPFYFSNAYVDTTPERFKPIPFMDTQRLVKGDLELVRRKEDVVKYRATGYDPRLTIKNVNIDLTPELILVRFHVVNSYTDYYNFYWDAGAGMSEKTTVKGFMPAGEYTVYQILPVSSIKHLRFDLGKRGTTFSIKDLAYAPLKYKPFIGVLNRLFNVKPTEDTL